MGQHRITKQPAGFAFVIFYIREAALSAVDLLHRTRLDNKVISVQIDVGFKEGRQYGRGKKGG